MKPGLLGRQQRGKGEAPPRLRPPPAGAAFMESLFPVCLPGKAHVTNPEGNADIIVSLSHTHVRPPSLPAGSACIPASILSTSPAPGPLPHTHAFSRLFLCLSPVTLSFVFFFLAGRLRDGLGWTRGGGRGGGRAHTRARTQTHTSGPPCPFPSTSLSSFSLSDLWH